MNTHIVDFLKNVSDENVLGAKENIHAVLSQKISDAIGSREVEIKNSLYNADSKETKET